MCCVCCLTIDLVTTRLSSLHYLTGSLWCRMVEGKFFFGCMIDLAWRYGRGPIHGSMGFWVIFLRENLVGAYFSMDYRTLNLNKRGEYSVCRTSSKIQTYSLNLSGLYYDSFFSS